MNRNREFFNCFLGIPFPEKFKPDLLELNNILRKFVPTATFVEPENSHITLFYLGKQKQNTIDEVFETINGDDFEIPEIYIYINELKTFNNASTKIPYVMYKAVEKEQKLMGFREKISVELQKYNEEERETYVPHLTLARLKSDQSKNEFNENINNITNSVNQFKWEFELKELCLYGRSNEGNNAAPKILHRVLREF